jgi:DNA polymerase III delta prime subunit
MSENIIVNENESLWVEKYRPKKINDCILPARLKDYFNDIIKNGDVQAFLAIGGAGCGKSTISRAMCDEMGLEYLLINASENGNIDTLRTTLRSFASTQSFTSNYKIIILDEADGLSATSQQALRGFMEEFHKNCRFILTANFKNKIIDAIQSRCVVIDFTLSKAERSEIIKPLDNRIKEILKIEGIEYDSKTLAQLIAKFFPDIRKILNHLQRHCSSGSLSDNAISTIGDDSVKQLFLYLKDQSKWNDMRKWVVENIDNDFSTVIRSIYDRSGTYIKPSSLPQLILTLSEYDYKSSFCADKELCLVACLTSLMADLEFK